MKPDIVAPGTLLTMANDDWEGAAPDWDTGLNGTSFSTPHVAGLMAQQLEAGRDLWPEHRSARGEGDDSEQCEQERLGPRLQSVGAGEHGEHRRESPRPRTRSTPTRAQDRSTARRLPRSISQAKWRLDWSTQSAGTRTRWATASSSTTDRFELDPRQLARRRR